MTETSLLYAFYCAMPPAQRYLPCLVGFLLDCYRCTEILSITSAPDHCWFTRHSVQDHTEERRKEGHCSSATELWGTVAVQLPLPLDRAGDSSGQNRKVETRPWGNKYLKAFLVSYLICRVSVRTNTPHHLAHWNLSSPCGWYKIQFPKDWQRVRNHSQEGF